MGRIFVEGLGVVEIAGEEPTEEEIAAIVAGVPSGETSPVEQLVADIEAIPEVGTSGVPGRISPVSELEFFKAKVREKVTDLPGLFQFGAEVAPATVGTGVGGAAGTLLAPGPGTMVGGAVGGLLGEILAQETGVSPESEAAKALSVLSPAAGAGAGAALKLGRRMTGGSVMAVPPARAAIGRSTAREAVEEFDSLGTKVLLKQEGLMRRPSKRLYEAGKKKGAVVPGRELKNTSAMLRELDEELASIADFPEAKQAIDLIDRTIATLGREEPISFDLLVTTRKMIGAAVAKAERASGVNLGAASRLFKAMSDDIDTIAAGATRARRGAAVAQAAAKRAKLEFSIKDFEAAVSRLTTDVPGEDAAMLNIPGLQKWLRDVTDSRSKKYNKNFTEALESELPALKKRLSELSKLAQDMNPSGRGSIVVRGITAGIGGSLGLFLAGPVGMGAGALIGASGPELTTAVLMSPLGVRTLKRAVRMGKGELPLQRWQLIGQTVAQSAGVQLDEEEVGGIPTLSDLQRIAVGGEL